MFNWRLKHKTTDMIHATLKGRLPTHHVHIISQDEFLINSKHSIIVSSPQFTDEKKMREKSHHFSEVKHFGKSIKVTDQTNMDGLKCKVISSNRPIRILISVTELVDYNFTFLRNNLISDVKKTDYAVLCIYVQKEIKISHDKVLMTSRYRPNLVTTNTSHFGSHGKVFGIGIRASYSIDSLGRSFGEYCFKKGIKKSGKIIMRGIEREVRIIIDQSMSIIDNTFQMNRQVMGLVTNTLSESIKKKFPMDDLPRLKDFAAMFVCVDAGTAQFHIEYDTSNTIIIHPEQDDGNHHEVEFQFRINHDTIYSLDMTPSVILLYDPYLLTHRQECRTKFGYINLAGYTNKRVVQNIKTSVCR